MATRAGRMLTAGVLAGVLAAGGCFRSVSAPKPGPPPAAPDLKAGPVQVKADGACLPLGELQQPGLTPDALATKVGELTAAGRREAARRYAARFPDVGAELLRRPDGGGPAAEVVAAAVGRRPHPAGAADRGYAEKRAVAVAHSRAGRPEQVVAANLPGAADETARADALRLHGQALLLTDRTADAVVALGQAVTASAGDPYQAAQCLLLLGEAQRRGGQADAAAATWARAVETAAGLLNRPEPLIDPGLWERAAYLKPVAADWPATVVEALGRAARVGPPGDPAATQPEAWVWAAAGQARADRGEFNAALAAFKRAETLTADQAVRDRLTVAQARVLLLLGQSQAAMAVLVPVTGRDRTPAAAAATALLGAMKLGDGSPDQALALLRRAVEGRSDEWPGRAEAEADLGLAYLSVGNANDGFRWLASARAKFQAAGEVELLARSWENEGRYWDSLGRTTEAAAARTRLEHIEREGKEPAPGGAVSRP